MTKALWIAVLIVLCALLGVAGHIYFQEWYGWLTSTGALALRVGPLFAWRVIIRMIRRWFLRRIFRYLPSPIKRLMLWCDAYVRSHFGSYWMDMKAVWKRNWLTRAIVLIPLMVACAIVAYGKEGLAEFVALFPIPFLFTAIFPRGFAALIAEYTAYYLTLWGFGPVVDWIEDRLPRRHIKILQRYDRKATVFLAEKTRAARLGGTTIFRRLKNRSDTNEPTTKPEGS